MTNHRVIAAIKAAGLDPNNPEHDRKFGDIFDALYNSLPEAKKNRLTEADVNRLLTETSNKIHGEAGLARLREQGRDKDATALFNLTGMSGKRRNELREANEQEQPNLNQAGANHNRPDDLFKQARKEGKV